jgi:hypothetical protein
MSAAGEIPVIFRFLRELRGNGEFGSNVDFDSVPSR